MPGMSSTQIAYNHIKKLIVTARQAPGTRLKEVALAAELGLSRTPVREALRQLAAEGLVEFEVHHGARVPVLSERELHEVSELRALLEGFAAELAAAKIGAEEVALLREIAAEMEAAVAGPDGPDTEAVSIANNRFHAAIWAAAGNGALETVLRSLVRAPIVLRKFGVFTRERLERSLGHHREIIAALAAGDPGWAGAAMRTHILAARSYDKALAGAAPGVGNGQET
jgi:DNA-binding GntR family transcriptional regulator